MIKRVELLSLNSKIEIAKVVVKDALEIFNRPVVVWSGGKDSTVVLNFVYEYCNRNGVEMPPSLFVDHGQHYDETLEFLKQVGHKWGVKLIAVSNTDVLSHVNGDGNIYLDELNNRNRDEAKKIGFDGKSFHYSLDSEVGNHLLKTVPMKEAIERYRFDALFVGVRWDENSARSTETFFSFRENPPHTRVHPILTFTEKNIWEYIQLNNLPIHPLYFKGYRSIDGKEDSKPISDKPAWLQDLQNTEERSGRAQDKEGVMEKLRKFGYM